MPAGSEFHTEGAATLKPQEARVAWTRGTDNRLALEECRERAEMRSLRRERSKQAEKSSQCFESVWQV